MSTLKPAEDLAIQEPTLLPNVALMHEIRRALKSGVTRQQILYLLDEVGREQTNEQNEIEKIEHAVASLFETLSSEGSTISMHDLLEAIKTSSHSEKMHVVIIDTPKPLPEDGSGEFPNTKSDASVTKKPRVRVIRDGREFLYTFTTRRTRNGIEIKLV